MKNNVIPDLQGRKLNGKLSKFKRIHTQPRQRIRLLLRSFVALEVLGRRPKPGQ